MKEILLIVDFSEYVKKIFHALLNFEYSLGPSWIFMQE